MAVAVLATQRMCCMCSGSAPDIGDLVLGIASLMLLLDLLPLPLSDIHGPAMHRQGNVGSQNNVKLP